MDEKKIAKLHLVLGTATPIKPIRSKAEPSQTIEGDQNTQTGGDKVVRQSIKGNGNTQIGGGVGSMTIRTTKGPKIEIEPPYGSIGANPALRVRIDGLIKQINDFRYQRLGKAFKFGAIHGELAKAFGLKPADWKSIWLWDESSAEEIVNWLESKRDNTQQGRMAKASQREGFQHTRGHMFRVEGDYLKQLSWDDALAKQRRQLIAGKASRADMSDAEFRHWVGYLRREVEQMYGETKD